MYIGLHVKCLLYLSDFNEEWICSKFSKFLTKICPVGAELLHADWWTDEQTDRHSDTHVEADSRISQFCKSALKLEHIIIASLKRPHLLVFAAAHFLLLKQLFCSNCANCYRLQKGTRSVRHSSHVTRSPAAATCITCLCSFLSLEFCVQAW